MMRVMMRARYMMRGAGWSFVLVALLALSGGACSPEADVKASIDDRHISALLTGELAARFGQAAAFVDVEVENGIATLSGTVPSLAMADRTRRIAKQVVGLRGVVDLLDVRAPNRPDSLIRDGVQEALLNDAATDGFDIQVSVDHGAVLLEGMADSWREKELATQVASGVSGVVAVTNALGVAVDRDRLDSDIEADVRRGLEWDVRIDASRMWVDVTDGTVALTGKVGTLYEQDVAIERAWVLGVKAVANELEIVPGEGDRRIRSERSMPSDQEIVASVEEALAQDPRVASFDIHVAAQDGTVLLLGRVSNLKAQVAAEEDARNTVGVDHVNNAIEVAPDISISDAMLEVEVDRFLELDPTLQDLGIDVLASAGSVRISGQVPSSFHKEWAGDLVSRVPGVVNVENDLRVAITGSL